MPDKNELALSSPRYVGRNWGWCDAVAQWQSRQSKGFVLFLLGCPQLVPPLLHMVCVMVAWQREKLILSLPGQECKGAINWRKTPNAFLFIVLPSLWMPWKLCQRWRSKWWTTSTSELGGGNWCEFVLPVAADSCVCPQLQPGQNPRAGKEKCWVRWLSTPIP